MFKTAEKSAVFAAERLLFPLSAGACRRAELLLLDASSEQGAAQQQQQAAARGAAGQARVA